MPDQKKEQRLKIEESILSQIPQDVWNIILNQLSEKDAISFLNSLRYFFKKDFLWTQRFRAILSGYGMAEDAVQLRLALKVPHMLAKYQLFLKKVDLMQCSEEKTSYEIQISKILTNLIELSMQGVGWVNVFISEAYLLGCGVKRDIKICYSYLQKAVKFYQSTHTMAPILKKKLADILFEFPVIFLEFTVNCLTGSFDKYISEIFGKELKRRINNFRSQLKFWRNGLETNLFYSKLNLDSKFYQDYSLLDVMIEIKHNLELKILADLAYFRDTNLESFSKIFNELLNLKNITAKSENAAHITPLINILPFIITALHSENYQVSKNEKYIIKEQELLIFRENLAVVNFRLEDTLNSLDSSENVMLHLHVLVPNILSLIAEIDLFISQYSDFKFIVEYFSNHFEQLDLLMLALYESLAIEKLDLDILKKLDFIYSKVFFTLSGNFEKAAITQGRITAMEENIQAAKQDALRENNSKCVLM